MRVLYLLYRYPQLSQTFVRNEIFALRRAGVTVDVLTVWPGDVVNVAPGWAGPFEPFPLTGYGSSRALVELARWSLRHPRRVARFAAHRSPSAEYRRLGARRLPALATDIRKARYDRVHTHFAWPSGDLARQLADLLDIPASITVHAKDIFDRPMDQLTGLETMDEVITVCRFNVDYLRRAGLRNPHLSVVACGVEIPVRPADGLPTEADPVDIIAVGRLVPKKGFDTLIDAAALLAGRGTGISVRVIGDGPERCRLQAQIDRRALGDVVRLTGPAAHATVLAAIAGAAVFCLPARRAADGDMDALPVVLREAQARAVPIVSTTVAGIPEVVDASCGWLVPPDDPAALAAALQQAMDDPADRRGRGQRGYDRVARTGTLDVQAQGMVALFSGAVGTSPRGSAAKIAAPVWIAPAAGDNAPAVASERPA